jgi:hypothetical protein
LNDRSFIIQVSVSFFKKKFVNVSLKKGFRITLMKMMKVVAVVVVKI